MMSCHDVGSLVSHVQDSRRFALALLTVRFPWPVLLYMLPLLLPLLLFFRMILQMPESSWNFRKFQDYHGIYVNFEESSLNFRKLQDDPGISRIILDNHYYIMKTLNNIVIIFQYDPGNSRVILEFSIISR